MGADRVYWASVVEQQEEDMSSFLEMEDILEFSNEDIAGPIEHHNSGGSCTSASASAMETQSSSSSISCNNNFSVFSIPATAEPGHEAHLCIPDDDLGELEWLTNLVEGGTSDHETKSVAAPAYHEFSGEAFNCSQKQQQHTYNYSTETASTSLQKRTPAFDPEISVPAKARSKRSRAPAGNLSSRIVVSSCTSSHSSSVSSDSSVADSSAMKRRWDDANYSYNNREAAQQRKCSHCDTSKTPQWRTGPLGPKTLCNACGVRYKSGRLVPEYRPAASPTFVPSKHSNSHRKVMEMRRQKDRRPPLFHGSPNTSSSSSSNSNNINNNNNKNTNNLRICSSGNKNVEDDENSQNRHGSWFDFTSSSTSSSDYDYDYDYDGCLLTTTRHDYRQLIL